MAWTNPVSPTSGTIITVAWAVSNVVNLLNHLRVMLGNADPPGSDYVVVSDSTAGTSWAKVPGDAIAQLTIQAINVADSAITSTKIAGGNVGNGHLASDSVTADKIATNAVGNTEIADNAVTSAKIAGGNVVEGHLASGSVTGGKIPTGTITSDHLLNGTIATADIADNAVTSGKVAGGNITDAHLASNSVTTGKILDANVTTAKVADNAITSGKVAGGNITSGHLASSSVTAGKIAAGAIVNADIADATITNAKLATPASGVPSGGIVGFETMAEITAAGAGWARYTAADGRILIGAGTAGSPTMTNPQTFTQATNYGTNWEHTHGTASLGPASGTTAAPSATTSVGAGGTAVASSTHTHTYPVSTLAGTLDGAAWLPALRCIVHGRKS